MHMKIIGLISTVVLTAAVVVSAAPEAPLAKGKPLQILVEYIDLLQEDTSPKELAAQLGADDYKDRALAQEQLLSMGQRAIPVLFALSKCSPGSTCKVRIQASSGGDAIIGEVKIYDLTAKDPGVIKANRGD
jgi:hypothetical protein